MRALVMVSRVVKLFDEMTKSVSSGSRSRVASAKAVPSTFETKRKPRSRPAVRSQRLVRHDGAEVRSSDPDVDNRPDRFPGVTLPLAGPDLVRAARHAVEHLVDVAHDVLPVDDQRGTRGHAQCDVQRRAILCLVDPLAPEHRIAALGDAGLLGQTSEEPHGIARDPVLRVVEVEPLRLGRESCSARRVRGKEVAEVETLHLARVRIERLPRGALAQSRGSARPAHDVPGLVLSAFSTRLCPAWCAKPCIERRGADSNRCTRLCRPLPNLSATAPRLSL